MSVFNYFIENNLPFVFRYKYSNPNVIRTVFIKEHKEDKGLIVTSEAFTCKIKTFKTDGIHFDTEDLLPKKYTDEICDELDEDVSITHFEDDEDRKCNDNKHQFLKYAIENNKTIAFEYGWNNHIMSPYRFCNFGKSVLMYDEKHDMFRTYDIEEIKIVRIPSIIKEEEYSDYLESSCCDEEELDISAIDEINEWE